MNWPTQSIQWDTRMFPVVGWAQQSRTDEDDDATELQYRTNDAVIKLTVTWPCSGYSILGVVRIKKTACRDGVDMHISNGGTYNTCV